MATLTVGTGKQYSTIAAALLAARDGDTVAVTAGTYLNDVATIRTKVSLVAVGGQVTMLATQPLASGKALLTVTTDATIDGFVFSGARSADGTAAALLDTGGALVVKNSLFVANQNGLVAQGGTTSTVLIQASEFSRNGNSDGFSHNVSAGSIASLTIQTSYIHDAAGGDEIKSRARATTITDSRIMDNAGTGTYGIDLPNAGAVTIRNTILEKGAGTTGAALIRYGGDTVQAGSSLSVTGDTIVSDRAGTVLLQNLTTVTAGIASNQVFGVAQVATGPAVLSANTVVIARPAVSTAALVAPAMALPIEYGRAGAVLANGTILTVGPAGAYPTLAAALAAAQDGDTIRIAAGTYTSGSVTITHKLIIEGTGGLARFVPIAAPTNGLAQFVTTTDVTFRNIEIAGVATPGGTAAAIRDQGGNLTLVNSFIHDNQAGIVADKDTAGSVGIYDTEIGRNGTPDGRGANVDVAEIGTLTLRNDWVHDALAGPEVRSRADNTVLDAVRISQTTGNGAADIDLPAGGRVTITASAIEKGANSLSASLINIGGDTVYAGSSTVISGTVLISDLTTAPTRFVAADTGTLALSGVTFVGGITGSSQVVNGTNTGALSRTGLAVAGSAPWGATAAPAAAAVTTAAPATPTAGQGYLVLRISETAFQGDAKFTLAVDGVAVGGTLVATASYADGLTQQFTIAGSFAPGPHSVTVRLVNAIKTATAGPGRTLTINGMSFNGQDAGQSATLVANGAATLSTGPITRPTPIAVTLSEDAAKGDAQAFIAIDGKVLAGVQTVTAAHATGQSQTMNFLLDLVPGPHTAAVTFLNPTPGRTLYIGSIDVAGQHYTAAAATLTQGISTFAFTLAPPAVANTGLFLTAGAAQALALLAPQT